MTTVFLLYVFAAVIFLLVLCIVCVKRTRVFTGLKSLLPSPEGKENSKPDRAFDMDRKVLQKEDLQSGVSQKPKINRRGTRNK